MTKLDTLIAELDSLGYSLLVDRKRTSRKWKAQAWGTSEGFHSWWKKGDVDGEGNTVEEAVSHLITNLKETQSNNE